MLKRFTFLVAVAAAAMPAMQAAEAQTRPRVASPAQRSLDRADFERGLRMSEGASVLGAIERYYPADYRRLVDRMFAEAEAVYPDRQQMTAVGMRTMQGFIAEKLPDIVNAPAGELLALNDRQIELLRGLRTLDPRLCAVAIRGELRDPTSIPIAARALAARVSLALIEAAGAGSRAARQPGRNDFNPADLQAWVAAIQEIDPSGATERVYASPAAMAGAAPASLCDAGIVIQEAVRNLPRETGGNLVAMFMIAAVRANAAPPAPAPAPAPPAAREAAPTI